MWQQGQGQQGFGQMSPQQQQQMQMQMMQQQQQLQMQQMQQAQQQRAAAAAAAAGNSGAQQGGAGGAGGGGGAAEVGQARAVRITGCKHDVVGPIIRGDYALAQMNHGKPAYKKEAAGPQGMSVMIYFWDERDGQANSGWWIGPQIGGNMVWGHHPNRQSATPPTSGWQAPHSAPADPSMVITPMDGSSQQQGNQQQSSHQGQQHQQGHQQGHQQSMQQGGMQGQMGGMQGQMGGGMGGMHGQMGGMQGQMGGMQGQMGGGMGGMQGQMGGGGMCQAQMQQQQQQIMQLRARQQQMLAQQQQQQQQQQMQQQQKAQWEAKMAEQRAQQQQRMQQIQEEQKRKQEEMQMRKIEQQATMAIRKCLTKLKNVNPDNFESIKGEVEQFVSAELEKCGGQRAALQAECEASVQQAKEKVDAFIEVRRKNEERQKEMERKREEAKANAIKLLKELAELIQDAESEGKSLNESVKVLTEKTDLATEAQVTSAVSVVENQCSSAVEKAKATLEFVRAHTAEMKAAPLPKKPAPKPAGKNEDGEETEEKKDGDEPEEEALPNLMLLTKAASTVKSGVDRDVALLRNTKTKLLARAKAREIDAKRLELFNKYDKNKDKALDKKEVVNFSKGEYKFTVPTDTMEYIEKVLMLNSPKGVSYEKFALLVSAIGIARERVKDEARRVERVKREEELAEKKKVIQGSIDEVSAAITEASEMINELLNTARTLQKESKEMPAVAMVEKAAELEKAVETSEEKIKVAREAAEEFGKGDIDKDVEKFVEFEKKRLQNQAKNLDSSITRAKAGITTFKAAASKKDDAEVKALAARVIARLQAFQAKESLTPAEVFQKIAKSGETFDKEKFTTFVKALPKAESEKEGEEDLSEEDLSRAFVTFDDDKSGEVNCETVVGLLWKLMKVVKDVAITANKEIEEDASPVRRLDVGEVVEVLEGPVEEGETTRIRARAMNDDVEGWVSVTNSSGSVFLKEGGGVFKVLKETIVTECFELEGGKATTPGKKEATRKLKPGELLEVRSWGKKQEETGLTRMKIKAKNDGLVGWVTTVGNTGIKFAEMV